MNLLDTIRDHNDLVGLNDAQRIQLCEEIRQFLVENVSKTGGHLASNLGVVELTVALETVFDTANDRLVFDVGHQSYVHKLLTGRQADFASLRQFGGMAGFPKPNESQTDAFVAGHASSSVSIALGMARARTLCGQNYNVIALIGDGATSGGMAFEGLNDAAVSKEPMIVILNDNAMSIDRNVGGMASHLANLRTKERYLGMKRKYKNMLSRLPGGDRIFRFTRNIKDSLRRMLIPSTIFESMGFVYLGPVDGHDVSKLIGLLRIARDMKRPVLLHVMTNKGQGYAPAERNPKAFHGVGKFDAKTGTTQNSETITFSKAFGDTMLELAAEDKRVCTITAAMPSGTGLQSFKEQFPQRTFDVGIAEEHAVSMAGGLAKQGMIPVVAIYSTFLQRAYDMILQDVAMLGLHVVFAVDRAGLVGEDGETHHGVFDVGFLRQVPGMTLLCPASVAELQNMMRWAVQSCNGPVAVRYPRGGDRGYTKSDWKPDCPVITHRKGKRVAILTYGTLVNNVLDACDLLNSCNVDAAAVRLAKVDPLPVDELVEVLSDYRNIVVVEEACGGSGIHEAVAWNLQNRLPRCVFTHIDLGRQYVPHGAVDALYRYCGLDAESIAMYIREVLADEN